MATLKTKEIVIRKQMIFAYCDKCDEELIFEKFDNFDFKGTKYIHKCPKCGKRYLLAALYPHECGTIKDETVDSIR